MIELKAITAYEANWKAESYGDNGVLVYLKSAADKVMAELKEKYNELAKLHDKAIQACCDADKVIAELKKQVHDYAQGLYVMQARGEKEARHHKYKRCLANAWWCRNLSKTYAWSAYNHRGWKIAKYYDKKAELYRK